MQNTKTITTCIVARTCQITRMWTKQSTDIFTQQSWVVILWENCHQVRLVKTHETFCTMTLGVSHMLNIPPIWHSRYESTRNMRAKVSMTHGSWEVWHSREKVILACQMVWLVKYVQVIQQCLTLRHHQPGMTSSSTRCCITESMMLLTQCTMHWSTLTCSCPCHELRRTHSLRIQITKLMFIPTQMASTHEIH